MSAGETPSPEVVEALSSFTTRLDGRRVSVKRGSRLRADDPIVQARPGLFVALGAPREEVAAARRALDRPSCVECRKRFDRDEGPGRPRAYCTDRCRRHREARLRRAMRDVARQSVPSKRADLQAAVRDVGDLLSHWEGRSDAPLPLDAPPAGARQLARNHLARLRRALDERRRDDIAEQESIRRSRFQKEGRASERAWREEQDKLRHDLELASKTTATKEDDDDDD